MNERAKYKELYWRKGGATPTVPVGHIWRFIWGQMTFTADATVTTRTVRPYINPNVAAGFDVSYLGIMTVAASESKRSQWGFEGASAEDYCLFPAAGLVLMAGTNLGNSMTNEQAGDDWAWVGVYEDILDEV